MRRAFPPRRKRSERSPSANTRFTRTVSDTADNLIGDSGSTGCVRVLLQGEGSLTLAPGAVLTPTFELELHCYTGDAETGAGL